MVEITVKAVDSASAMEEVEKRLGADALIVSTNRVDGQIEIVATNDEPSKYQKPSDPLILDSEYRISNFSDILGGQIEKTNKKNSIWCATIWRSSFRKLPWCHKKFCYSSKRIRMFFLCCRFACYYRLAGS